MLVVTGLRPKARPPGKGPAVLKLDLHQSPEGPALVPWVWVGPENLRC